MAARAIWRWSTAMCVRRQHEPVLVRVHSHCLTGDVFGTTLCDCHSVMRRSLQMIAEAGCGALVYLHNTSKGFEIDRSVVPGRLFFHRRVGHSEDPHEGGLCARWDWVGRYFPT